MEEEFLHPIFEELQSKGWDNNAILKGIEERKLYRCARSFRRGADITATNIDVGETVINFVHRWDKYEQKGGRQPGFEMIQGYADGINTHPLRFHYTLNVSTSWNPNRNWSWIVHVEVFETRMRLTVEGVDSY